MTEASVGREIFCKALVGEVGSVIPRTSENSQSHKENAQNRRYQLGVSALFQLAAYLSESLGFAWLWGIFLYGDGDIAAEFTAVFAVLQMFLHYLSAFLAASALIVKRQKIDDNIARQIIFFS